MRSPPAAVWLLCAGATACGTAHRAAEPAVSPPPHTSIAGRQLRVGHLPEGIAVDPSSRVVAVATRRPGAIVLLSAATGRQLARIPFPGEARHLAFGATSGQLLIPDEPANRLFSLQPRTLRLTSIPVGHHPHAVAALGARIFVTDELVGSVSVIRGDAVIARVTGFRQPGGVVAAGRGVAIVDVGSYRLTLLDGLSLRPLATEPAGQGPTHAVADGRGSIYVADTRGDAIEQFTTSPRLRLEARLALPGTPYGVALDPVHARLWVTLTATDQVVEVGVRGGRPRVLAAYPTGRQPNSVAADPVTGWVWVANAGDDTVQLIQPSH